MSSKPVPVQGVLAGDTLDSLWAKAEYLGRRVEVDTTWGSERLYKATILLGEA